MIHPQVAYLVRQQKRGRMNGLWAKAELSDLQKQEAAAAGEVGGKAVWLGVGCSMGDGVNPLRGSILS